MWRVSLRDLQWRRRRVLFAVLATGLVLGMSLTMAGTENSLFQDARDIVGTVDADRWIVAEGAAGPFTTTRPLAAGAVDVVASTPGVDAAAPVVILHSTLDRAGADPRDVNVIGGPASPLIAPTVAAGRLPRATGEVAVDVTVDAAVGDRITVGGRTLDVVGQVEDTTWYFGAPSVFVDVADAQALAFDGSQLATAVVTRGVPVDVPDGLHALTGGEVIADLDRLMESSSQTLAILNGLLWLTAAGIIGLVVYLSALERVRDLAVLKATGAGSASLAGGLVLQALVLTVASAVVGTIVAQLMAPTIPFGVVYTATAYARLFGIALAVGVVASLAGLRRVLAVDPALAFGGR